MQQAIETGKTNILGRLNRSLDAAMALRIWMARGSQSNVCAPPIVNVPMSSPVMPQKVQKSQGYLAGSWWVAWVR